jgi:hypothetical protein
MLTKEKIGLGCAVDYESDKKIMLRMSNTPEPDMYIK